MKNLSNTKAVYTLPSRTTTKILVKMSNINYGYIDNRELKLTRNATSMVMHSILIFAEKNNLLVTQ